MKSQRYEAKNSKRNFLACLLLLLFTLNFRTFAFKENIEVTTGINLCSFLKQARYKFYMSECVDFYSAYITAKNP